MSDGTALTAAQGDNDNALMQVYKMADPIVVDASKIPATVLNTTYLYDIPTSAGQLINLINASNTTGIIEVEQSEEKNESMAYDLLGRRVTDSYHGIVIVNGNKYIR